MFLSFAHRPKFALVRKVVSSIMTVAFLTSLSAPAGAQLASLLPTPGSAVTISPVFVPPTLKGLNIHPENPFLFDFIVGRGDEKIEGMALKAESEKLVKFFLTAMTIPDKEAWVNLSPYEANRIIPDALGKTEMGKVMLEQDYLLKQLASSLTNPDTDLGKKFWNDVRAKAKEKFGTTDIPMSTFNKVWIVPSKAEVAEKDGKVFITKNSLKVMLEEDYEAMVKTTVIANEVSPRGTNEVKQSLTNEIASSPVAPRNDVLKISSEVFRSTILPTIEKEINEGKNFAAVRQIYDAAILAVWYKSALKESLLGKIYADKSKVKGIETDAVGFKEEVYKKYVEAFKKGAYNMIKEDFDMSKDEAVPTRYFSGGVVMPTVVGSSGILTPAQANPDGVVLVETQFGETGESKEIDIIAQGAATQSAASVVGSTVTGLQPQKKLNNEELVTAIAEGKVRVGTTFIDMLVNDDGKDYSYWFKTITAINPASVGQEASITFSNGRTELVRNIRNVTISAASAVTQKIDELEKALAVSEKAQRRTSLPAGQIDFGVKSALESLLRDPILPKALSFAMGRGIIRRDEDIRSLLSDISFLADPTKFFPETPEGNRMWEQALKLADENSRIILKALKAYANSTEELPLNGSDLDERILNGQITQGASVREVRFMIDGAPQVYKFAADGSQGKISNIVSRFKPFVFGQNSTDEEKIRTNFIAGGVFESVSPTMVRFVVPELTEANRNAIKEITGERFETFMASFASLTRFDPEVIAIRLTGIDQDIPIESITSITVASSSAVERREQAIGYALTALKYNLNGLRHLTDVVRIGQTAKILEDRIQPAAYFGENAANAAISNPLDELREFNFKLAQEFNVSAELLEKARALVQESQEQASRPYVNVTTINAILDLSSTQLGKVLLVDMQKYRWDNLQFTILGRRFVELTTSGISPRDAMSMAFKSVKLNDKVDQWMARNFSAEIKASGRRGDTLNTLAPVVQALELMPEQLWDAMLQALIPPVKGILDWNEEYSLQKAFEVAVAASPLTGLTKILADMRENVSSDEEMVAAIANRYATNQRALNNAALILLKPDSKTGIARAQNPAQATQIALDEISPADQLFLSFAEDVKRLTTSGKSATEAINTALKNASINQARSDLQKALGDRVSKLSDAEILKAYSIVGKAIGTRTLDGQVRELADIFLAVNGILENQPNLPILEAVQAVVEVAQPGQATVAASPLKPVGGINFDPTLMNLQVKRDKNGVPLPVFQQDLPNINIEGLYPVIINIAPATMANFPLLSKAEEEKQRIPSAKDDLSPLDRQKVARRQGV